MVAGGLGDLFSSLLSPLLAGITGALLTALAGAAGVWVRARHHHHSDLNDLILDPWIERLQLWSDFGWHQLRSVWINRGEEATYKLRFPLGGPGALALEEAELPVNHPLWEASKEHWPRLHRQWENIQEGHIQALESTVRGCLQEIESRLEPLETPDSIRWVVGISKILEERRRMATCGVWKAVVTKRWAPLKDRYKSWRPGEEASRPNAYVIEESDDGTSYSLGTTLRTFQDTEIAEGSSRQELERIRDGLLELHEELQPRLDQIEGQRRDLVEEAEELLHGLRGAYFAKTLEGKCPYCPHPLKSVKGVLSRSPKTD